MLFMMMIGLGTLRPPALAESRLPSTPPAKTPAAIATPRDGKRVSGSTAISTRHEPANQRPDRWWTAQCGVETVSFTVWSIAARTTAISRSANSRSLQASDDTARWPNIAPSSSPQRGERKPVFAVAAAAGSGSTFGCGSARSACSARSARSALRVARRASMRACSSARCWESSRSCWLVTSLGKLERRSWSFRRSSEISSLLGLELLDQRAVPDPGRRGWSCDSCTKRAGQEESRQRCRRRLFTRELISIARTSAQSTPSTAAVTKRGVTCEPAIVRP